MGLASLASVRSAVLSAATLFLVGVPFAVSSAQDAYPKVEVRQLAGAGSRAWGSSARVKIDRDAFVVVIELGVDGRARVVFPESPREKAFVRADRLLYVPLPSADVMFIRSQRMRTPTIVAFASDVAPDLSEFTKGSGRWDYQYAIDDGETKDAVRDLATLIYGDPDMPYSVSESHIAPTLSAYAQNLLIDCGYILGGSTSLEFTNFLWDLYGPYSISASPWPASSRLQGFWSYGVLGSYMPFGLSGFSRFTSRGLWDRFGAGCGGLRRYQPFMIAILNPGDFVPTSPYNAEGVDMTGAVVPPPKNRTDGDPRSTVDGVSLSPASPAAIARRENAVTTAVNSAQDARTAPVREAHQDMIQRAEIARTIAMLASQERPGVNGAAQQGGVRRGAAQGAFGGSAGYGGAGTVTRASTSSGSGSSSGVGGSSGGGSSSVGSGSSSAGEASRGGAAGGGRAGSGGRVPPQ